MADILVYALHYEGAINKNSLGAVSEGARLASELGGECHAIVVGGDDLTDELAGSVGAYGATKVYRAKAPEGLAQPVVDAMAKVIADNGHGYALFGGGLLGFEVGAGLAARLGAGVAMEVTAVRAEGDKLVAERPILGDSAISEINFRSDVGIIIGRLNAFEAKESGSGAATVEDVEVELSPQAQQATMVQRGEQRGADVDIEGADVLVAGGRGLGKAEGFELVEALAKAFGGNSAVAATRAVVDAGWYPYAAQIGQTGKTVAPKLYLAAGISGAIQHKVGMQSAENIVAINKDANAPIFEFSDLGIVGDLNKIVPKLTDAIKAKKGAERMASPNGRVVAPAQFPPAGRLAAGVHQARARRRGGAHRGRGRHRGRRPRRPGVREQAPAAAGRRAGAHGAPRRGAGGGHREGQGVRRPQPVRRDDAPVGPAGALPATSSPRTGRPTARSTRTRSTGC